MDPVLGGALISAGSNLLGSLLGGNSNNHAGRDQRQATSYAIRASVLDKVAAAKEAGISPLYALGAPVISASSAVGSPSSGTNLGETLRSMGSDIGRAVASRQTAAEKMLQALAVKKAGLENDLLQAQIANLNSQTAATPSWPPHAPIIGGDPVGIAASDIAKGPQHTTHGDLGFFGYPASPLMDAQTVEDMYDNIVAGLYGTGVKLPVDIGYSLGAWLKSQGLSMGARSALGRSNGGYKTYYDRIPGEGAPSWAYRGYR